MRNTALGFPDFVISILPFLQRQSIYQQRNENNTATQVLLSDLKKQNTTPIFSYTHLLMPHMPFYYDSVGKAVPEQRITSGESYEAKQHFLSYLKYTNTQALKFLQSIRQSDPSAIIIFMSDHGVPFEERKFCISNFDNLCVVRFPNQRYGDIPKQITNVNLFRYVLNSQFRKQCPMLKDTSFTRN